MCTSSKLGLEAHLQKTSSKLGLAVHLQSWGWNDIALVEYITCS
jgi:hypothetical protein